MSFLQPAMLLAIPVIALPIIIHLINQRRFQTVQWAAMLFLLAANRMSRGYARLRQWLILAARTLAIAGLIFAISRPLTSGWLGIAAGSRVDTTIILLDRSASMSQSGNGGRSKLDSGIDQLVRSLGLLPSNRYVLIDSVSEQAVEIDSPDVLAELPGGGVVSASADLPAMLETAAEYIRANRPSRCEIWICSDVRRNDWNDDSGRWQAIRTAMVEAPQMIGFHLLAYADTDPVNRSIRVTDARRVEGASGAELLLSLRIEQLSAVDGPVTIPIQLELDGARSEFTAELTGSELELKNQSIPLDGGKTRGWGRVSIPSDSSPADNEFYFVYDMPVPRRAVVVTDDPDAARPLELAASISPDPAITCQAQSIAPPQWVAVDWDEVSLVLWQAALPEVGESDSAGGALQTLVNRGGQVIFFPPEMPTADSFAGLSWTDWQTGDPQFQVASWVSDQDVLSNTRSGASLPVGELKVLRCCGLEGDRLSLATLSGGTPLLARAPTDQRNVYFCTTTTAQSDSSLARDGVVLYATVQRLLAAGAQSLGNTRQWIAGSISDEDTRGWRRLAGNEQALSNEFASQAGVYEEGDRLLAINRSLSEDTAVVVPPDRVASLFEGLDFDRVDDTPGSGASLIQEIWRLFLILMLVALVLEAVLCLPRKASAEPGSSLAPGSPPQPRGVAA